MKTEKVLIVVVMVLIGLFISISVDFSMILTSTISSAKIANLLILNDSQHTTKSFEIEPDKDYSVSINDHISDFLNLKTSIGGNEIFSPILYKWLWENLPSE